VVEISITGPAPKDDAIRRNKPTFDKVIVEWDGIARGPALPDGVWHQRTRQWWLMWQESAQAMVWEDTDWEHMLETAVLHSMFWNGSTSGLLKPTEMKGLAEHIRARMAAVGSTFEDRRKLRLEIRSAEGDRANTSANEATQIIIDYVSLLDAAAGKSPE
jgi:hypothetical protein